MSYRNPLAKHAGSMRDPDRSGALRAAREAYEASEGDIVLINQNWLTGWADKELLRALAKKAGVAKQERVG